MTDLWNRCDVCGRFIALADFDNGAVRELITPDSYRSRETFKTLCVKHGRGMSKVQSEENEICAQENR